MEIEERALLSKAVLNIRETAKILRTGPDAVRSAIKAGTLPSIKVGRRERIVCAPLREMLGISNSEGA